MEDFKPVGVLFSETIEDTGKHFCYLRGVVYLHGLTGDDVELLITPGKKKGEFILWHRPVGLRTMPRPERERENEG